MQVIKSLEQFKTYSNSITSLKTTVIQGIESVQKILSEGIKTITAFEKQAISEVTPIV